MAAYRSALACLPKTTPNAPELQPANSDTLSDSDEVGDECSETKGKATADGNTAAVEKEEEVVEVISPAVEQSEREMKKLRAVLNANIAACYLKLVRHLSIQLQGIQLNFPREITKTLLNRALKV